MSSTERAYGLCVSCYTISSTERAYGATSGRRSRSCSVLSRASWSAIPYYMLLCRVRYPLPIGCYAMSSTKWAVLLSPYAYHAMRCYQGPRGPLSPSHMLLRRVRYPLPNAPVPYYTVSAIPSYMLLCRVRYPLPIACYAMSSSPYAYHAMRCYQGPRGPLSPDYMLLCRVQY
eukprot:1307742-Rhodomonas_salina.5